MNERDSRPPAPERLVHDPDLAELLARADGTYRAGLDEPAAFQRLSERLEAQPKGWGWQQVALGAVALGGVGVALALGGVDDGPRRVTLSPEVPVGRRVPPSAERSLEAHDLEHGRREVPNVGVRTRALEAGSSPELARDARGATDAQQGSARALPSPRPNERRAPLHGHVRPNATSARTSAAREAEARLDCPGLIRKDARAAERCYTQRASSSSGLSAEAALYELARLRRDVQRDARGALAALNDYRERFPQGSLRNEVGLTRVEILSELGRGSEALAEAEALLASAQGRERAAELYVLRGNIFRHDLGDAKQAIVEYSRAEAFGGAFGAEATRLRGLSLESLGDLDGALAAYRRYLSGAEQPRRSEVDRRVAVLIAARSTAP